MPTPKTHDKNNGSYAIAAGTPKGDGPTTPRGKGNTTTITPSGKPGESGKDTSTEATCVKRDHNDEAVDAATASETKAAIAAGRQPRPRPRRMR